LKSTNGILLKGARVQEKELKNGDQFKICSFSLIVQFIHTKAIPKVTPYNEAQSAQLPASVEYTLNLGAEAGTPIENAGPNSDASLLSECVDASNSRLNALIEAARYATSGRSFEDIAGQILEVLFKVIPADRMLVAWFEEPDLWRIVASKTHSTDMENDKAIPLAEAILSFVRINAEAVLARNAMADERFDSSDSLFAMSIRSLLAVPLFQDGVVQGVLQADAKGSGIFDVNHLKLATVAGYLLGDSYSKKAPGQITGICEAPKEIQMISDQVKEISEIIEILNRSAPDPDTLEAVRLRIQAVKDQLISLTTDMLSGCSEN